MRNIFKSIPADQPDIDIKVKSSPYLTESALMGAIECFTKEKKTMPKKICGTFDQLCPISNFNHYSDFMGKYGIMTSLGMVELELDADAERWYLV